MNRVEIINIIGVQGEKFARVFAADASTDYINGYAQAIADMTAAVGKTDMLHDWNEERRGLYEEIQRLHDQKAALCKRVKGYRAIIENMQAVVATTVKPEVKKRNAKRGGWM